MKNIYIIDEYSSSQKNGIGTYLCELLYCLRSLKYNICLITFDAPSDEFSIIEGKGMKKILFPTLESYFLIHTLVIEKFLQLYIEDSSDNVYWINHAPCGEFLESLKVHFPLSKIVFTIHDLGWTMLFMGDQKKYIKYLGKINSGKLEGKIAERIKSIYEEDIRMYSAADSIVCLSKDTVAILRDFYKVSEKKLHFIPNGIRNLNNFPFESKSQIKDEFRFHSEDKILLFVGRPTKEKGLYDLLIAMDEVLQYFPKVKLVVVGNYGESSMNEMIRVSSKNAASVIYTGQLDKKSLKKWFAVADIGVIPSYYEQCSYTGIEMMRSGLPIVASDGFGVRCMFTDGVNAKIARIGNRKCPKEFQSNLAAAVIDLLQSTELCDYLKRGALKTYKYVYNIKRMSEQYQNLIDYMQ